MNTYSQVYVRGKVTTTSNEVLEGASVYLNGTTIAILNPTGDITNPLDIFSEGYWSYEQFGDLLPLNYQPPKD